MKCFICDKPSQDYYEVTFIHNNDHFRVCHAYSPESHEMYKGWIILESLRHFDGPEELTQDESIELGITLSKVSKVLVEFEEVDHVYIFRLGHGVSHFHIHLLPKYKGTPREYWGSNIDEWPQAPKLSKEEVEVYCAEFRSKYNRLN